MFRPPYRWTSWYGFSRNIWSCWHDLTNGIRNVFKWLPLIWFDADYDWCFLATLMEFKLNNMADYIGGHDRHTRAQQDARRMRLAAKLIQRVRDDEYYEKLAGKLRYEHIKTPVPGRTDCVQLEINAYKENGEKQSDEEFRRHHNKAIDQRNRELALFGKIIGKYLLYWWD